MGGERATLDQANGAIAYRFSARDLHRAWTGTGRQANPLQGDRGRQAPGENHGADIDADGNGTVAATRLYQLVRQAGDVQARTFEIRFLDPGVQAYAFTFG